MGVRVFALIILNYLKEEHTNVQKITEQKTIKKSKRFNID